MYTHRCYPLPLFFFFFVLVVAEVAPATAPPFSSSDDDNNGISKSKAEDRDSDAAALAVFKSSADLDDRLCFPTTTSSCQWQGVQCSPEGRVTKLVLEKVGLRGRFVVVSGRSNNNGVPLDQLRVLSLKNNSLSGPIPDLSALSNLKALFLSHNSFIGSFPSSALSLHRLHTLDLSSNALSGPIPTSAALFDRLNCLRLDRNRLNGSIPAFNHSSLKIFNVSSNALSGPVPPTPVLLSFGPSAFSDNPALCGTAVRKECRNRYFFKPPPSPSSVAPAEAMAERGGQLPGGSLLPGVSSYAAASSHQNKKKKKKKTSAAAAGLTAGTVLALGLLAVLLVIKNKRRKQGRILSAQKGTAAAAAAVDAMELSWGESSNSNANGNGSNELAAAASISEEKVKKLGKSGCLVFCAGEASIYTLEQLMKASAEMLGRGTVGTTYKAILDNRLIVGVKRLDASKMGTPGKEAFERHMETVGRLRHPNLVPLRAYFQAKEERLLVYDYQPNGSLYSLIHGSRSTRAKPLHWTSCLKIAEDVAQGLAYIHQASRLVHGNLKSTNVLLGAEFEACITDNCLAFLVEPLDGEEDLGHRAPEARNSNRHLTAKSDIYSFGILLLELLTGKPPLQHPFLVATNLPAWVQSIREENGGEDERLMMLLDVATACVKSSPESRPTTWQVLKMIQEVKEADMEET